MVARKNAVDAKFIAGGKTGSVKQSSAVPPAAGFAVDGIVLPDESAPVWSQSQTGQNLVTGFGLNYRKLTAQRRNGRLGDQVVCASRQTQGNDGVTNKSR